MGKNILLLVVVYLSYNCFFELYGQSTNCDEFGNLLSPEICKKQDSLNLELSLVNTLYSIADYCDIYDRELYYSNGVPTGVFAPSMYIPHGDSVGCYFPDMYHHEIYKLVRPVIHSNYKEIMRCIRKGERFLSFRKHNNTILSDSYFYKYKSGKIVYDSIAGLSLFDKSLMDSCAIWMENFARIINYEQFLSDNRLVFAEYLDSICFDVERFRIWMNANFSKKYDKILFRTSPFDHPFNSAVYEIDSLLILTGGVYMKMDTCYFSPKFQAFNILVQRYTQSIFHRFRDNSQTAFDEDRMERVMGFLYESAFLLYCRDMEYREEYHREKSKISCTLNGFSVKGKAGNVSFPDFFENFIIEHEKVGGKLDDVYLSLLLKICGRVVMG